MTLETFFNKFDQFVDAPDAVEKMRELVLQLAVRGQLVPQNPKDEPATKAIERLVALNGSGRTAKLFAEEESVDLPFDVPASWKWVRFGDLVRIRTGKLDANAAVEGGEYPFFTCSKTPSKIATYSFDTSAVILAGNGDFNLKSYSGKFDAYQRTYVIEPLGWELGFCFWLISAQIKRITDNQRGSAIPYLRLGDIADPLVPFPPLAEQKRIVTKVEELMALLDELEKQQKEREEKKVALSRSTLARFADAPTPANLKFIFHSSFSIHPSDLRKSILTLAVQGKLVPQNPNDEPAESPSNEVIGEPSIVQKLPFDAPERWTWRRLGAIALIERGGSPRPIKDYLTDDTDGFNWIKIGDTEIGGKYITSTREKIIKEGLSKTRRVYPGDFLLTNSMSFGRPYICMIEGCIHDGWLRIHPPGNIAPEFLYHLLSSPYVHEFFGRAAAGAVVQNLNSEKVRELVIPIPPLAEQRRIVAKVDQLMALVDELEAQLATSRTAGEKLLAALVAELTTGKISHAAA